MSVRYSTKLASAIIECDRCGDFGKFMTALSNIEGSQSATESMNNPLSVDTLCRTLHEVALVQGWVEYPPENGHPTHLCKKCAEYRERKSRGDYRMN